MQGLAVIAALLLMGYGFAVAGLAGAVTGLVAAVGVGSGLAIGFAERGTGVAARSTKTGMWQRRGGILAAIGCGSLAYYGGWGIGWLWGIGGYLAGMVVALTAGAVTAGTRRSSTTARLDSEPNSLPQQFDLKNANHVLLLDEIRERYSMALSDDTGAYAQCMYKPASLLPYPKTTIRGAMNALLDFIEGRVQSPHLDVSNRSSEAAEAVKSTLVLLDNYLDIPASELPTEPKANGRVAAEFLGNGDA